MRILSVVGARPNFKTFLRGFNGCAAVGIMAKRNGHDAFFCSWIDNVPRLSVGGIAPGAVDVLLVGFHFSEFWV